MSAARLDLVAKCSHGVDETHDHRLRRSSSPTKKTGSSEIRAELAGGEDHALSVVGWVAEAACDAAVEFDNSVDGLGAAVVRSALRHRPRDVPAEG